MRLRNTGSGQSWPGFIDTHAHLRDWLETNKATIRAVMRLAINEGFVGVFEMPNTKPEITTRKLVEERFNLAEREGITKGHFIWIGITSDPKQVAEAAEIATTHKKVVGIKMYAGKSVGGLSITDPKDQQNVYRILTKLDYRGVITVHCEKQEILDAEYHKWDQSRPATWNLARPPIAEIVSVREQIKYAEESGFKGVLNIAHISTPEAIFEVEEARKRGKIRITCEVTPHHLKYSTRDMLKIKEGLEKKVNPPIRDPETVDAVFECVLRGQVNFIGTDHAPHTPEEKSYNTNRDKIMSGIPSLVGFPAFIDELECRGVSWQQLYKMTYGNAIEIFPKIKDNLLIEALRYAI